MGRIGWDNATTTQQKPTTHPYPQWDAAHTQRRGCRAEQGSHTRKTVVVLSAARKGNGGVVLVGEPAARCTPASQDPPSDPRPGLPDPALAALSTPAPGHTHLESPLMRCIGPGHHQQPILLPPLCFAFALASLFSWFFFVLLHFFRAVVCTICLGRSWGSLFTIQALRAAGSGNTHAERTGSDTTDANLNRRFGQGQQDGRPVYILHFWSIFILGFQHIYTYLIYIHRHKTDGVSFCYIQDHFHEGRQKRGSFRQAVQVRITLTMELELELEDVVSLWLVPHKILPADALERQIKQDDGCSLFSDPKC